MDLARPYLYGVRPRVSWTDAFAVCTYASLHRWRPEGSYLDVALRLVDQVHHVLGRYWDDDPRRGWISGLADNEGEARPTAGGLRIGKPLPDRAVEEPLSSSLGWDRDGQYFHYLTKWMLALHRVAQVTYEPTYERWSVATWEEHCDINAVMLAASLAA